MRARLRVFGVTVASIVVDLHDGLETIELVEEPEAEAPFEGWPFKAQE